MGVISFTALARSFCAYVLYHFVSRTFPCLLISRKKWIYGVQMGTVWGSISFDRDEQLGVHCTESICGLARLQRVYSAINSSMMRITIHHVQVPQGLEQVGLSFCAAGIKAAVAIDVHIKHVTCSDDNTLT